MSSHVEEQPPQQTTNTLIDAPSSRPVEFHRQTSGSNSNSGSGGLSTTPVQAVTAYLKNLLGLTVKPTKRSLSEEAECGSPDSLGEWLRQGSDPNEIDAYGYTPLVNACLRGCKRSVTILLINGADVNKKAMHGYTPLHAAAQVGYIHISYLSQPQKK